MELKNLHSRSGEKDIEKQKRHREQTYGRGRGEERVRCMERVTWKLTLPYVN